MSRSLPHEPDPVVPDTKDWTWVLERSCPDCGFDTRTVTCGAVPALLRAQAAAWRPVLARDDVRERPAPAVWSALEYACHVRDVYRVFAARLDLMLREAEPTFPNWDQDATARDEGYRTSDPAAVADALVTAADALALAYGGVRDEQWDRVGRRSDGAVFSVDTLARYLLHDPAHHLWDVGAQPAAGAD